jgi:hypothetical protein
MRDRVGNDARDLIERDIIHTETPNKVVNVANVFLMWLWGKECFEEPLVIVDLADVSKLCKGCDAPPHDGHLTGTIVDFLDAYGVS